MILGLITSIFSELESNTKDILSSLGLEFLFSSEASAYIWAFLPDLLALGLLLLVRKFFANSVKSHGRSPFGSLQFRTLYCWTGIGFLGLTSLFGSTLIYSLFSFSFVLAISVWSMGINMDKTIFGLVSQFARYFSPFVFFSISFGHTPLAGHISSSLREEIGFVPLKSVESWVSYTSLFILFLMASLYQEGNPEIPSELAQVLLEKSDSEEKGNHKLVLEEYKNEITIAPEIKEPSEELPLKPIEPELEEPQDEAQLEIKETESRTVWESLKRFFMRFFFISIYTPDTLMHVLRFVMLIWVMKYNCFFSMVIFGWIYYSIAFEDRRLFYRSSTFMIVPIISAQYLCTKLVNTPSLINTKSDFAKFFPNFGCFLFGATTESINQFWEYFVMLLVLILVVVTFKLTEFIPLFEKWEAEHPEPVKQKKNALEATVGFLLKHADMAFMGVLYLVCFKKLNISHLILFAFLILNIFWQKAAFKCFRILIYANMIRSVVRNLVLMLFLCDLDLSKANSSIFPIFGIEIGTIKKNNLFYKTGFYNDVVILFFALYIQYWIIDYLKKHQDLQEQETCDSFFMRFVKGVFSLFKKLLLWIIYLILFLVLSSLELNLMLLVYNFFLLIIVTIHVMGDLFRSDYRGFIWTRVWWIFCALYNGIALTAVYLFCFSIYTAEIADEKYSKDPAFLEAAKIVGLDFATPSNYALHVKFLPQVVVLYLSHLAREHIMENMAQEQVDLTLSLNSIWTRIFVQVMDFWSNYSFHALFFVIGLFGFLWNLGLCMWLLLALMGVHYLALHLKIIKSSKNYSGSLRDHTAKLRHIRGETILQQQLTLYQRKLTLKFLLVILPSILFICQICRFCSLTKIYTDRYLSGENRLTALYIADLVEAGAMYMGTINIDTKNAYPFVYSIFGYIFLLYLGAIETRFTAWAYNKMGYVLDVPRPQLSEIISAEQEQPGISRKKIMIMVILKVILEYVIIGAILLSAVIKNNFTELALLPLCVIAMFFYINTNTSYNFSVYNWILLLFQFLMCVLNMTNDTTPQIIENITFKHVFRLRDWPIYKIWMEDVEYKENWATYCALGNMKSIRREFITDLVVLLLQALYFQHFAHTLYSLTQNSTENRQASLSHTLSIKSTISTRGNYLLKGFYNFIRKIFFVYSHIFTLFMLLLLNILSEGFTGIVYLTVSVIFIQFKIFAFYQSQKWSLPLIMKFVLMPYVFFDLLCHYILQIPSIKKDSWPEYLTYIGFSNIEGDPTEVAVKIFIFCIIVYQNQIYSSRQYLIIVQMESNMMKKLEDMKQNSMAYLHNNKRVYEFGRQKYNLQQNHAQLNEVKLSIRNWENILKRTGSRNEESYDSGLLLDIDEKEHKIKKMKRKLDEAYKYPYTTTKYASFLEMIYLFIFKRVNHVCFVKRSELPGMETNFEEGLYELPNYVSIHHKDKYIKMKKIAIEIEKMKLERLNRKLMAGKNSQIPKIIVTPPQDKEEKEICASPPEEEKEGLDIPEGPRDSSMIKAELRKNEEERECLRQSSLQEQVSAKKLLLDIFILLLKLLYSSSDFLCYAAMIAAHCYYGSILSLPYVLSIFGYALLVRSRPNSLYWRVLLIYAGVIILLKFLTISIQRYLINVVHEGESNQGTVNKKYKDYFTFLQSEIGVRFGLFDGEKFGLTMFMLFDVLVIFFILFHTYVLSSLGLYEKTEEDIETLEKAIERINKNDKFVVDSKQVISFPEMKDSILEVMNKAAEMAARKLSGNKEKKEEKSKALEEPREGKCKKFIKRVFFSHSIGRELFPQDKNTKPGKDFNSYQLSIQFLLCIYTIFFFSNMSYEITTLSDINIKEFSASTVFALLTMIVFILIDIFLFYHRPISLSVQQEDSVMKIETFPFPNYALLGKWIHHLVQLLVVHMLVFWILPNLSNIELKNHPECQKSDIKRGRCNETHSNPFLLIYYLLYCLYFYFSAQQIRYSWPERDEAQLRQSSSSRAKIVTKMLYAIPFVWELKLISAWLWTRTSFNLFQWIKFEEIYINLFFAKCESNKKRKILIGEEIKQMMKFFLGGCGLFILIILIIAPVLIFSALNPMVSLNPPTKASMEIELLYGTSQSFDLLRFSSAQINSFNNSNKELKKATTFEQIKGLKTEQYNVVTFPKSTDFYSLPTMETIQSLHDNLEATKDAIIKVKLSFTRNNPSTNQEISITSKKVLDISQKGKLKNIFVLSNTTNSDTIELSKVYCRLLILPIDTEVEEVNECYNSGEFIANMNLTISLTKLNTPNNDMKIPLIHTSLGKESKSIVVVSERVKSSYLLSYSLITLYISVVLVVGKLLRGFISGSSQRIIYEELPRPEPLLNLSSGVILSRFEGNLIKEGELYYELIDVLRSTEILKLLPKPQNKIFIIEVSCLLYGRLLLRIL